MPSNDKLIRWFDLLAALLRRRYAVTFTELAHDVPAYAHRDQPSPTLLRMFERDKDELRRAGIRIETVLVPDGDPSTYQLRAEDFYLPYLVLSGAETPSAPAARVIPRDAIGARRLPTLSVLPEEAVMLRRAAERVQSLGEPQLVLDAAQALRKLRHDLPDVLPAAQTPDVKSASTNFAAIADAVHRRKRLTFEYLSMGRGGTDVRTVHPYGLVYLTGNWYLVAHDTVVNERRQFRTSRMSTVKVNGTQPNSADFDPPANFDLRAHARSRQAWELGRGDEEDIDVHFVTQGADVSSATRHAAQVLQDAASEQLSGSAWRYRVRRRDTFLRWLLSFAGNAEPVGPPAVVADWCTLLRETLAVHTQTIASTQTTRSPNPPSTEPT